MSENRRVRYRVVFGWAVAISLLLLLATGARSLIEDDAWRRRLLPLFLGTENNIAAWWSGMLLLLSSLLATDGARRSSRDPAGTARSWLMIAALLLFLSADEVGSLHERIGGLAIDSGFSEWIPLGILAILLGGIAATALLRLWNAGERAAAVGVFVGFLLLASVAPQEYLEHRLEWSSRGAQAARVVVEEGTELLGMLILLWTMMRNTARLSADGAPLDVPFAVLRRPGAGAIWFILIVVCPLVALLSASFPDQHRGHPADWVAASAFLAAALVLLRPLIADTPAPERRALVTGAVVCVVASACSVAIDPLHLQELVFYFNVRLSVLAILACLFALTLWGRKRRILPAAGIIAAAGATMVVGVVLSLQLMLVYLVTQLLALAVLFTVAKPGLSP